MNFMVKNTLKSNGAEKAKQFLFFSIPLVIISPLFSESEDKKLLAEIDWKFCMAKSIALNEFDFNFEVLKG